jgi:MarR family 2-MHQ and catechol resistance regulon transcriptional repressor
VTQHARADADGASPPQGAVELEGAISTRDLIGDPRLTAVGLFMEAADGLRARLATQIADFDLTNAEFEVLVRLARTPGGALRMSDLAVQTQLTTSGITRVVDRLERDRLVARRACPTDRRGLLTEITEAGRTRLHAVLPGHLALLERWLTGLFGPVELETLLAGLRVVRDAVRPDATAGARTSTA